MKTIKRFLLFTFLDFLGYIFLTMPHFLRFGFAKKVASLLCFLDKRHKKKLLTNLEFAYNGTLPSEQIQEILYTNYLNLVYNTMSFFMLSVSSKEQILNFVEFQNPQIIQDLLQKGENFIFVTAHFGNWEYTTPAFTCYFNTPITAVARMTHRPLVDEYLLKVRSKFQVRIIDKHKATLPLVKTLKKGKIVGIVTDQNTSQKEGILVDFFGKKVRQTPIASYLSLKLGIKIIPVSTHYTPDYSKCIITCLEPIQYTNTQDFEGDIQALTQIQSDILEKIIRENPKEWLWFHKKFKNQYPQIYEENQ